ncbi:hypothetical protein GHI93_12355 [Lactococcus hircilactis]|uniref:Uncharacterized protein n=1 Tax=Lactococcus hircilactis TaxID=1494462 RepID=A0A7X2D1L2_9LACT|nr:hypothetical protein [Lactococcus hircilactis]MQW40703.1 hypothetical protein [Lactococcus hircilactis]
MDALFHNRKVKVWKISDSSINDEWVEKAFYEGRIRWLKFDGLRLQVMDNQIPYSGSTGEYLVYDSKGDRYSIVNELGFLEWYNPL